MRILFVFAMSWMFTLPAFAQMRPMAYAEVTVNAPVADVWTDWTTTQGLESFYAPKAIVDLKPGGAYEVWFLPDAEPGMKGAEDGVILGYQDKRMLQYTWKMPPYMPEIKPHMTVVQMYFDKISDTRTRVRLYHTGFGDSEKWQEAQDYFKKSWPAVMDLYGKKKASNAPD